jgi:hypothetical protein
MKHFPILRTRRLTLQLKELTIGQSSNLAGMPAHLHEASCTAFLRAATETASIPDPVQWTVQDRIFAVAHFLAIVSEDGPDFAIGSGKYTDYLDGTTDTAIEQAEIGEIGGDRWVIRHLRGYAAESIERLVGEVDVKPRLHWLLGAMSAQLTRQGEAIAELTTEGQYDEWLLNRMRVFAAFPESDFEALALAYEQGRKALNHLFAIDFNDTGIVVLPNTGADGGLPPARFRVSACLSPIARAYGR